LNKQNHTHTLPPKKNKPKCPLKSYVAKRFQSNEKAATPRRHIWSDLEAFDKPALPTPAGYPYVTEAVSPWWRIVEQFQTTEPHVEGFTTWEWHKYG
jgi:hypothetical protein